MNGARARADMSRDSVLRSARAGALATLVGVLLQAGCASQDRAATAQPGPGPGKTDDFLVVDCLLPSQVRKLGQHFTYLAPRQAIKTSARDCEIRGGEYVAYDRANYATALKVWLPLAEQGDTTAQTYVGEIFEKGLGVRPDYDAAATWYRRAAEKGSSRAAIDLGNLYERGLGMPKDPAQALNWYRRAAGLPQLAFEPVPGMTADELKALIKRDQEQERRLKEAQEEADKTRAELELTQEKEKELKVEIASLRSQIPSPQPDSNSQPADSTRPSTDHKSQPSADGKAAGRPLGEVEVLLAQKMAEARALDDSIARMQARSGARRQDVDNVMQARAQIQTDIRALKAGLEPAKQEGPQDGPRITFDQVQLVEPAIFIPTRDIQPTQVRIPTATRSWIVVARVTSDAGLKSLSINERAQAPSRNVFKVSLTETDRQLVIVATDRRDRTSTLGYRLPSMGGDRSGRRGGDSVRLTSSQISQLTRSVGTYHALVIGNNNYRQVSRLRTAVNDAQEIAKVLQEQYGFRVTLLTDATRHDLLRALDELRGNLTKEDNLLIYYAGHGKMDEEERGYWLPVDAEANGRAGWIANENITGILDAMAARQILLVADSCYSGTLARSAMGQPEPVRTQDEMLRLLQELTQKRSRIAMTSGRLEPVLDSAGGRHSVFAEAFLKALRDNDGVLLGQDFFRRVQLQVADVAGQLPLAPEPQYAPIHPGYEAGDFVFVRPQS
jgi:caspase domain-containing protein/Sel1 repeat-containing protein